MLPEEVLPEVLLFDEELLEEELPEEVLLEPLLLEDELPLYPEVFELEPETLLEVELLEEETLEWLEEDRPVEPLAYTKAVLEKRNMKATRIEIILFFKNKPPLYL